MRVATCSTPIEASASSTGSRRHSLSQLRISRWLDARGYSGRSVYRANSFIAMLDAVKSGIGVAVMPCYLGDREPQLQRVGEPIAEPRGELWLLTHPTCAVRRECAPSPSSWQRRCGR